jgi:hypothetical protein
MKYSINCPSCASKVKVPKDKVPQSGAWAICPICRERFFIPGYDIGGILEVQPAPVDPSPAPRSRSSGGLPPSGGPPSSAWSPAAGRRLGGETRVIEKEGAILSAEPPRVRIADKILLGLVLTCVVALMAGLVLAYIRAAETGVGEAPPPPSAVKVVEYGFSEVKADLLFLRRKLTKHDRYHQVVNYRGVESRLFKHVQGLLAPDACRDIVALRLDSDSPRNGFNMRADCLAPKEKGAVLDVRFMEGWAVVRNHDTGLQLDVPLLASAQRQWDRGARQYKPKEPDA